ncbi:hypothetical protein LCM20_01390 [Halobacillus litoralis]|uniref:hypothetical protein n=1 Tax=Halobacillus litoralis TaxID=45668 RepID=UPI001CD232FA|nr:hypothetical protein [Halobacillus litoralis]MCA0969239.1 hypothetical protein [Halobacillus litoralis]
MGQDKLYWMLMPPFLMMALLCYFLLPQEHRYYSFAVLALFWVVYYGLKYMFAKKTSRKGGR